MGLVCGTGLGPALGGRPGQTGTTYYFSATGSDAADGLTPATAKQTITAANSLSLNAGDTIAFKGGDTFSGALVAQRSNMSYTSYGTGKATISSGTSAGITVTNKAGVSVSTLTVTGGGITAANVEGIRFENSQAGNTTLQGVMISGCNVSGYGGTGILVVGTNGTSGFTNIAITGCTVANCTGAATRPDANGGSAGIKVAAVSGGYGLKTKVASHSNIIIDSCTVSGCTGMASQSGWTGSGIFLGECQDAVIQYCTSANNSSLGNAAVGIWCFDSKRVTIQYCEAYGQQTTNTDGSGFDLDGGCQDCVIQYCYAHDNEGHGFMMFDYDDASLMDFTGNVIRFNVSVNNCIDANKGEILVSTSGNQPWSGNYVYNNTCYNDRSGGQLLRMGDGTGINLGVTVANNIFVAGATNSPILASFEDALPASGPTVTGNLYYCAGTTNYGYNGSSYTSFASWQTATGFEKISGSNVALTSDPKLTNAGGTATNDYRLRTTSPAIDAGLDLASRYSASIPAKDYYGNTIGALPTNLGAYDGPGI